LQGIIKKIMTGGLEELYRHEGRLPVIHQDVSQFIRDPSDATIEAYTAYLYTREEAGS